MALKRPAEAQPLVQIITRQRVGGRGDCDEACGVSPRGTVASADLGVSSKYSSENLEV